MGTTKPISRTLLADRDTRLPIGKQISVDIEQHINYPAFQKYRIQDANNSQFVSWVDFFSGYNNRNTLVIYIYGVRLIGREAVVPRENHWYGAYFWQTYSHRSCIEHT